MDHSYYRDKISAYSDGALEMQERELIRRHLEECAECRRLLEKLSHLSSAIEEKSELKNDEYFENLAIRIEQRIATPQEKVVEVRRLHWTSFWWKISAAAATLVLVGTIGYYQLQDDQEMPAKVLENLKVNRESVPVMSDSVTEREVAEFQGGRTDTRELVGEVAETETPRVEKEESNFPVRQEEEKQITEAEDLLRTNTKFAPTSMVALKPSELKEKASGEKAATSEKADVAEAVVDEADQSIMFEATSDSATSQQLTLSQWRSQRDSLRSILGLEKDTVVYSINNQMKRLAAPSVSGMQDADKPTKAYQELANTWFQIALQTQDGDEKNRAIQFLNWYKSRFPADSTAVNIQLQQVPK